MSLTQPVQSAILVLPGPLHVCVCITLTQKQPTSKTPGGDCSEMLRPKGVPCSGWIYIKGKGFLVLQGNL